MTDGRLHPGLEGIAVAETRLSRVDGESGDLVVVGYPVGELAGTATYEETLYLLLHGRLPTAAELADLRDDLAARRDVGGEVLSVVERAAREGRPAMDALRMGAAAADLGSDADDPREEALRAVAVLPTVVAAYWRYREGVEPVDPDPDLGRAANYLYMLTGTAPTDAERRGLETYLTTVIEHGLNASTFSARVVVSTGSDLISAVTAAVGTLKGPLHGGAPGPVLDTLRTVHESGDPEGYVRETLDAGERLMGFGHRVYRVRDPRAAVLEAAAEQFYRDGDAATDESGEPTGERETAGDADFFRTVREFEDVAVDLLAEHKPDRRLETNVEFYTAALLYGVGVPRDLFTATFAVSRVGGWVAHGLEQLDDNRLVRPTARYTGPTGRTWTPVEDREARRK